MSRIFHEPAGYARWIAIAPASIAAGVLALLLIFAYNFVAPIPGGPEALLLWLLLSALSVPAVFVGVLLDVPVVERETGVEQSAWVWAVAALVAAPLVGTVYLRSRRRYFADD